MSPSFLRLPLSYGTSFIRNNQFTPDADFGSDLLASQHLPEWIYIYHAGLRPRKHSIPAASFNQGGTLYFVGE
ncbi:hypothetical protein SAMN04490207_1619 [Pseudomonas gessardii]|nr:hypothetical protein SAMN04490207_1619 [Pseudomonas gessardii]